MFEKQQMSKCKNNRDSSPLIAGLFITISEVTVILWLVIYFDLHWFCPRWVMKWLPILLSVFYGGSMCPDSRALIYWMLYKYRFLNLEKDEQNLSGSDWKSNWILPSWNEPLGSRTSACIELPLICLNSTGVQKPMLGAFESLADFIFIIILRILL